MRWVIWLVILFVVAALAAGTLGNNDGVVSIYWSPWRVDLSLNLFLLGIVVFSHHPAAFIAVFLLFMGIAFRVTWAKPNHQKPTSRKDILGPRVLSEASSPNHLGLRMMTRR